MAQIQSIAILYLLMLALGTTVSTNEQESARTDLVIIPSAGVNGCPVDEERQAARQLLHSVSNQFLQNISINPNCGPGLWRQVFYLNVSNEDQSCPGDWNARPNNMSISGCAGTPESCQSAFSGDINTEYNKVCGRLLGIGGGAPDAFFIHDVTNTTIEDNYLDGVSVTHGANGSRTHIWSFSTGHPLGVFALPRPPAEFARCPCDNSNLTIAPLPPSEVGENYFCSRSTSQHLWTGDSCTSNNPCCSYHDPPYFSVQFPTPITDQIELRICTDERSVDEMVFVQFAEIYVQ